MAALWPCERCQGFLAGFSGVASRAGPESKNAFARSAARIVVWGLRVLFFGADFLIRKPIQRGAARVAARQAARAANRLGPFLASPRSARAFTTGCGAAQRSENLNRQRSQKQTANHPQRIQFGVCRLI